MSASPESGVQVPREPRQSTVQRSSPNTESRIQSRVPCSRGPCLPCPGLSSDITPYHVTTHLTDPNTADVHHRCVQKHDRKLENCIFQPEDTFSAARHSQENSTQTSSCIIDSNRPIRAKHREHIHSNKTFPKFSPHWTLQPRHPQIDSCG